jgi:hypothetical protein
MTSITARHVAQMFTQHAFKAHQAQSPEALQALNKKNDADLHNLHRNFFDTAQNAPTNLSAKAMAQVFGALSPKEALLLAQSLNQAHGYHDHVPAQSSNSETSANESAYATHQQSTPLHPEVSINTKKQEDKSSFTATKNHQTKIAEQSIEQIQRQTQFFVANMLGGSASQNMTELLGSNACFEDVLMYVMMKIAKQEEKNIAEKIKVIERGHSGLTGLVSDKARDLGGVAGGAIGAGIATYFGGAGNGLAGAAVGQDIGERLIGSYTGNNSQESRQIQFEKLKHMMHKLSEMMACISNVLATIHQTNKNTLGNIRG